MVHQHQQITRMRETASSKAFPSQSPLISKSHRIKKSSSKKVWTDSRILNIKMHTWMHQKKEIGVILFQEVFTKIWDIQTWRQTSKRVSLSTSSTCSLHRASWVLIKIRKSNWKLQKLIKAFRFEIIILIKLIKRICYLAITIYFPNKIIKLRKDS